MKFSAAGSRGSAVWCRPGTFPRKRTKSPTVLMAVTRRAFSTRMMKASRAEVQKLVLLIAVAV